jgi:hypothetical protein
VDHAGACSTKRRRCFRFVYDGQGKRAHCPEPIAAVGWTKLDRWYEVDACEEHASQLRDEDRWALRGVGSVATWPWLRGRTLPDLRSVFTTAAMCFESVALRRWGTRCDGRSCGPQRQSAPFRVSRKPSWVSQIHCPSIGHACALV